MSDDKKTLPYTPEFTVPLLPGWELVQTTMSAELDKVIGLHARTYHSSRLSVLVTCLAFPRELGLSRMVSFSYDEEDKMMSAELILELRQNFGIDCGWMDKDAHLLAFGGRLVATFTRVDGACGGQSS